MNFDSLFSPKSIAIIGASRREKTVGNDIVKNLATQGYAGEIYPVNPSADELYGKKVYHSIDEVPGDIELAVIAIPSKFVPATIEELAKKKNTKAAIVISAGFKEMGNVELEEELKAVCEKNNVTLVGPNCLGAINADIKMNASFAVLMPEAGNIAFMSQSGALCTAVLDYAQALGIGFSKFVSIGNKAAVDELDLIKYLAQDDQTKVILMYAEGLNDAQAFIETLKEINRGPNPKPVIILKSGRTAEGAGAIASHTGSLAGGDAAYEALFAQAGMIRANSIEELFNLAQIFSKNDLNNVENVTIITNAGGPGVLTTDEVISSGLKLTKLSEKTEAALKEFLPVAANTHNPVDILGDALADRYEKTLEVIGQDENTDAILLILTPQSMTEIDATAKAVIAAKKTTDKPMAVCFMGEPTVESGVELMRQAGITTTTFPEPAAKGLSILNKFSQWVKVRDDEVLHYSDVDHDKVAKIFAEAKKNNKTSFPEAEAVEILKVYNFPVLQAEIASSPEEAEKIAKKFGTKLAMKIVSQDILHKSDVGGVRLNVTAKDAAEQYQDMLKTVAKNKPQAKLDGALMMEMAPKGTEVILGVMKDPSLGTMVMFGLGGIYVEVLKDVSFSIAPITRKDAERMIDSLRSKAIFEGVRGEKPADREALIETLGRLSQLVSDFPEIKELDVNPLLALPSGAKVLDARIVIE